MGEEVTVRAKREGKGGGKTRVALMDWLKPLDCGMMIRRRNVGGKEEEEEEEEEEEGVGVGRQSQRAAAEPGANVRLRVDVGTGGGKG
jgi:hypothetical protein